MQNTGQRPAIPFQNSDETLPELVPRIKSWRTYRTEDFPAVKALVRPASHVLFGNFDLEEIIALSAHQIVMENNDGDIIACMCLRNYPNIPSILPEVWKEVFAQHYYVRDLNFENTLFIHLILWDSRYAWEWVTYVLKSLYLSIFRLQFVVIVMLPGCAQDACFSYRLLGKYFHQSNAGGSGNNMNCQRLYVSLRQKVMPVLRIRRAVAEDNDDLVEILNKCSPKLQEKYGDFYISEIVLKSTDRSIIVAEHQNEPVGMMSFNVNVRLDIISANYDLTPYHGLRQQQGPSTSTSEESFDLSLPLSNLLEPSTQLRDQLKTECALSEYFLNDSAPEIETVHSMESSLEDVRKSLWMDHKSNRLSSYDSEEDQSSAASVLPFTQKNDRKRFFQSRQTGVISAVHDYYSGQSNCFIIELHAMHSDYDDRMVHSLLETSFETYPDLTYCLLSVPSVQRHIPLLSYFVRIVSKPVASATARSIAYVLHRNALFSTLTVRRTIADKDEAGISEFLKSISKGYYHANEVLDKSNPTSEGDKKSFVVVAERQIIGVCILQSLSEIRTLMLNYEVGTFIESPCLEDADKLCLLRLMILHPAFTIRLPFIVSELFRYTGHTSMFYKLKEFSANSKGFVVNTMLAEMIPVRPRIRMEYNLQKLRPDQYPPEYVRLNDESQSRFALYMQTVSMCTKRKMHINHRLVIVGCSSTAMAFLEHLIFSDSSTGIHFTHLTLISPNGFSNCEFDELSNLAKMFRYEETYTPEYVRRLAFCTWVNSVYGSVTNINRSEKYVVVENKRCIFYDRLYIFAGLQFDYPINIPTPLKQPKNVVLVNNTLDAELMLMKVNSMILKENYNIIVYGDNIYCYTCLLMLIESHVDPSKITFIRPRVKPGSVNSSIIFNDDFVDGIVDRFLMESQIKVLNNYDITDWRIENKTIVSRVAVESDLKVLELPCSLFVCFERLIVARSTIVVLNQAGLVFDGRLVINKHFQTNDPCIYSAGPMTKFKRILYADKWRHEFVSSQEVGCRLAHMTLKDLSPLPVRPISSYYLTNNVHIYHSCKVVCNPVLGGYYYLCIHKPGRALPYVMERNTEKYGVDLITGKKAASENQNINYCRIHLNHYNYVETIVCLTKTKLNVVKYMGFYGLHETMLSNIKIRFENKTIHDLHSFFDMPWTYLLFFDYRHSLRNKYIGQALARLEKEQWMINEIQEFTVKNKWQKLDVKQRIHIIEAFLTSTDEFNGTQNLIEFIIKHIDELSMFFNPKEFQREF